jgi:hypothetical protein
MNGGHVHANERTPRRYHPLEPASLARVAAPPLKRRLLTALLGFLLLALAAPALAQAEATEPSNPNNYECSGGIGAGTAEAGGEETPVKYQFLCNGQITGYQIQTQVPITGIEGSSLVTNHAGTPLNDTFSCSGAFPGYAVNCVGASTTEPEEKISGQFEIGWKLCTEPRVDALLTVTYAYVEKGAITQAISGPFELGRPLGCPATALSGKTRLTAYRGPEPKAAKQAKSKRSKHGKRGKAPKRGTHGRKSPKNKTAGRAQIERPTQAERRRGRESTPESRPRPREARLAGYEAPHDARRASTRLPVRRLRVERAGGRRLGRDADGHRR